jgi:osmotically-inducible protein OsmY
MAASALPVYPLRTPSGVWSIEEENMSIKNYFVALVLIVSSVIVPSVDARRSQDSQQPAPDNTKTNERDRDKSSPTADQQKVNPSDREITRNIRASIHKDKSLSTYAHNVKIIAQNGKVTLKGPVRSEEEKNNIGAKATAVAGDGNVDNQLDVVAPRK